MFFSLFEKYITKVDFIFNVKSKNELNFLEI